MADGVAALAAALPGPPIVIPGIVVGHLMPDGAAALSSPPPAPRVMPDIAVAHVEPGSVVAALAAAAALQGREKEERVGMPEMSVSAALAGAKKKRDQNAKNARRPKRKEMAPEILVNLREREAKRKRETYVPRGASEEEVKQILESAEKNRPKGGIKQSPPPPGDTPPLPPPPLPPQQPPGPPVATALLVQGPDLPRRDPPVPRTRRVGQDIAGKKKRDQSAKNNRRPKRKDLTADQLQKVRDQEAKRKRETYVPRGDKRQLVDDAPSVGPLPAGPVPQL
ncbi:hypothetical protein T484DRAFT_2964326 [Baffinella frigidus]|nr:hypothetical protein T484DRAFT_2964326 [Cryptophyta sp. CCMP2293]